MDRIHLRSAVAGSHEHRKRRSRRGRRYAADLRAGCERQYRLCGGIADYQRAGNSRSRQFEIRTIADLKGKRIGFAKGTSAHNVLIATLEKAGLTYEDITPVYLSPPDAGPAFANGSIEAWAIWDPYFAIGEKRQNGRILVNASEVAKTNSFYLANRDFANTNVQHTRDVIEGLAEAAQMGGGAPRRGCECPRCRDGRAAGSADRCGEPRVVCDRPGHRRNHRRRSRRSRTAFTSSDSFRGRSPFATSSGALPRPDLSNTVFTQRMNHALVFNE